MQQTTPRHLGYKRESRHETIICAHCGWLAATSPCAGCQSRDQPTVQIPTADPSPIDMGPLPNPDPFGHDDVADTIEGNNADLTLLQRMPMTVRQLANPTLQRCLMAGDDDCCDQTGAWRTTWSGTLRGPEHHAISSYMQRLSAVYSHRMGMYRYIDTYLDITVWRVMGVTHITLLDFGGHDYGGDCIADEMDDFAPEYLARLQERASKARDVPHHNQVAHPNASNPLGLRPHNPGVHIQHTARPDAAQIGGAA